MDLAPLSSIAASFQSEVVSAEKSEVVVAEAHSALILLFKCCMLH